MHVISFVEHLLIENYHFAAGTTLNFEANKGYLFADKQFDKLKEWDANVPYERVSKVESMFKPLRIRKGKGKGSVIVYNGVGGMGDQIMTWPLTRILSERGYDVHVLTEPHLLIFWQGFPWIQSIMTLPCYWTTVQRFDHHVMFEYVSNGYAHEGQMQPIDLMLQTCGIDPASVPDDDKRVAPRFTRIEIDISNSLYRDRRLAFYQLAASQQIRALGPEHSRAVLRALAEAFPHLYWIAIFGPLEGPSYWNEPMNLPNVEFRAFERPRLLWSLIRRSELCVSPDSMLVHAAGAMERPCVGLWGPYGPSTRVKYYRNHRAIHHRHACPIAPCHWNASQMPHICPPSPSPQPRERCEVMLRITPEEVVSTARDLLASVAASN